MADERIEIEIVLDDGSIKKGIAKISRETDKLGKGFTKSFSKDLGSIKNKILGLGAAFAAVFAGGKILREASKFEEALAEIATITSDLNLDTKALAKNMLAVASQFGTGPQEQAKSFYQIISAGVTDAADAQRLLISANKLAIGGLTDTETAIDLLTSAVNAFGQENISAERAADILFGTVKLGKTTVAELASGLGKILPTAAALKISFEDTAAAIAELTTKGISTSIAITQLNAVFTAVLKNQSIAASMGKEVADAFSLQALQAKGLGKFLKDLNKSLGGSEEKLVKLLGAVEGARAIMALAGKDFKGLTDKIEALKNSAGSADAAFRIISQTTGFQLKQALAKVQNFFIGLLAGGEGTFFRLAVAMNQFATDTIKAFDRLPLNLQGMFANISLQILGFQQSLAEFGAEGGILATLFGLDQEASEKRLVSIVEEKDKILAVISDLIDDKNKLKGSDVIDADSFTKVLNDVMKAMKGFSDASKKGLNELQKSLANIVDKGIVSSITAVGRAFAKGEDAGKAFLASILNTFGDFAIQYGTLAIGIGKTATAMAAALSNPYTGAAAIPLGIALIALGGALKGIASNIQAGGFEGAGGGAAEAPEDFPIIDQDQIADLIPETLGQIIVNVDGTILDPRAVGLAIAELLRDVNDSNDIITVNV